MVLQEMWATLTVYNVVRRLMAHAAAVHGIDPRRISFVDALVVLRMAAPRVQDCPVEGLLQHYSRLLEDVAACARRRWRRKRQSPRALRVKTLGFRRKKPGERCVQVDFLANLKLGAAS
jgi:hypothetical protein